MNMDHMPNPRITPKRTVLAVASKGGHWEQMLLLIDAFEGSEVTFVTTDARLPQKANFLNFVEVQDYNQDQPVKVLLGLIEMFGIVRRIRPDAIISTGAAPGLVAMVCGRLFRAQTIWVDSIANTRKLSLSGRLAKRICHVVLSQWPNVAQENSCLYKGSVL